MARDHVQFRAAAAVGLVAATGAHHRVTMGQPCFARGGVAPGWETLAEPDLGGVTVAVRQRLEGQRRCHLDRELGRQFVAGRAQAALAVRVAPLHDEIVLGADDGKAVEVFPARELAQIVRVLRRKGRGEFDHHPALRQLQVERVFGVEGAPIGRRGGRQDFAHRARRRTRCRSHRIGRQGRDSSQRNRQGNGAAVEP